MAELYLILEGDGASPVIRLLSREGVEGLLAEISGFAGEVGGGDPVFLSEIPVVYGMVCPGHWDERDTLILKVEVVVPQPVTTKWALP